MPYLYQVNDALSRHDLVLQSSLLASGTYTPTLTNVTNITTSGSPTIAGIYLRSVNSVSVVVYVDIDPTTGGALTTLGISLPVASNLGTLADLGGTAVMDNGTVLTPGRVIGDAANNRAQLDFYADAGAGNRTWVINFMYRVI